MGNDKFITTESLKTILPIHENHVLEKVKDKTHASVEPSDNDIPTVFITGNIPTSKDYVLGELEYRSNTDNFHAYTFIKLQGTSTLGYPKKNFTINLFSDEYRTVKLNKHFKHWGSHNNFVLKADYIDILRARNVVCAKLWNNVVASRVDYESLPDGIRNSPNNCAIDGFPVKVYIDGTYAGLYNWTIPKCDWMYGMDSYNKNHVALCSEFNDNGDRECEFNPCNFNKLWDGNEDYWSIEVGESNSDVVSSLNNVIQAVINEDTSTLEQFLDIQSLIDYYVFQEIIRGSDGLAKNMQLVTYDMKKWYVSAYDMDSTFGLDWTGDIAEEWREMPIYDAESEKASSEYNNAYSAILKLIFNRYKTEYVHRYFDLRKTVLSEASIVHEFEKYIGIYGEDVYIKDTVIYSDIPNVTTNTINYISDNLCRRLFLLDEQYMEENYYE